MDQALSSATSIQDTNAALMAQHKAVMAASSAKRSSTASSTFASELQSIEKVELAPPTPLSGKKTVLAEAPQAAATALPAEPENEEECPAPKISRSARMACAEKATQVQETPDDFGFDDFVDLVNPLQHIPIIGTIYRELTGDTIKPEVQVAGSIGFGVLTGSVVLSAIAGIASAALEQSTGKEPLVQVADALFGDSVQVPDALTEDKIVVADAAPTMAVPAVASQPSEIKQNAAAEGAAKAASAPQQKILAPMLASTGSARMGNIIYTSPMLKSAAKVNKGVPTTTTAVEAQTASAKKPLEDTTLGTLIHEQAKSREAGNTLPPELVQDMMAMALDKYKAANMASASTGAATMTP